MKKPSFTVYALIIAALCLFSSKAQAQPPYTLYSQNFDGVTVPSLPSGWSTSSSTSVTVNNTASSYTGASGAQNLLVANCTPVGQTRTLTLSGVSTLNHESISIHFGHRRTGAFDVAVTLEWSNDGSTWYTVSGYSTPATSSTWTYYSSGFLLPAAEADNQSNLRFRWTWTTDDNNNCVTATPNYRLDDVLIGADILLPSSISNLHARALTNQSVLLAWQSSTERKNDHFLVQRSTDGGKTFATIGRVEGKGDSNEHVDYEYMDTKPAPGTNYYRLQQFDFDGSNEFFGPVAVRFGGNSDGQPSFWPVPTTDILNIQLPEAAQDWLLQVYDLNGRLMQQATISEKVLTTSLDVARLPAGSYLLRWNNGATQGQERFVKQ